ncbi:MAG TPA: hypothetical protein VMS18_24215 [Candidatus Binatia bacterium]|nr:hypothetical protein [Candidatus Binatia bacterium]
MGYSRFKRTVEQVVTVLAAAIGLSIVSLNLIDHRGPEAADLGDGAHGAFIAP